MTVAYGLCSPPPPPPPRHEIHSRVLWTFNRFSSMELLSCTLVSMNVHVTDTCVLCSPVTKSIHGFFGHSIGCSMELSCTVVKMNVHVTDAPFPPSSSRHEIHSRGFWTSVVLLDVNGFQRRITGRYILYNEHTIA